MRAAGRVRGLLEGAGEVRGMSDKSCAPTRRNKVELGESAISSESRRGMV